MVGSSSPIERYCVRINCGNENGSGIIIPMNDSHFVFTAYHCIHEYNEDVDSINIYKQSDFAADPIKLTALEIIDADKDEDYALLRIDYNGNEPLKHYKLGQGISIDNDVKFIGYQGINKHRYRHFDSKTKEISDARKIFMLTLNGDTFDQGGEEGSYLARGLSGSGVFILKHKTPFLIGILKSVITDKAWNDDIECCSINNILKHGFDSVDLSDFNSLKNWNENISKERTEREIEAFKKENTDFFKKLYRKNCVLYPEIGKADTVTSKHIRKFLAMKENIRELENNYPLLYSTFQEKVKRFVDQVEDDYSRSVSDCNVARDSKLKLNESLKEALDVLPDETGIDLSDYQIIEWLGICTLNFTNND